MTGSLISVVVPAYNAEATIVPCIHALRNQQIEQPYEIIVVDDGSTDNTAELARDAGATVISIVNSRPAAARNTGIRVAKGDLICFTDADCVPHPDWLREITTPFEDDTVVACKGIYSSRQTQLMARFVQLEYEDKYDLMRGAASIDFIDTYSAAYRREILVAERGFDEQFTFLEDQELSFRLAERGHRMVFQPTAVVEHRHPSTLIAYIRKKYLIGYWKSQIVRRFPNRLVRDSHTPQIMKVQMMLAILLLAASSWFIVGALFSILEQRPLGTILYVPLLVLASIFAATTLPFVRKAWSKDTSVALASPLLLFARALSLGFGYVAGVISPRDLETNPSRSIKTSYPTKRVLDVIGSVVGLIFTVIVWPLVALLIKLDSEGPVIFRQERIGERGKPFTMLKFRTMQVNAAEQWPELVASLGLDEPVLKLTEDPRITRVGRFLRRWCVDELPQFWNVLRGDMSLVGPRPEEPRIVAYYSDYHRQRLAIKPGMTGPMQIDECATLSLSERVALDLDYINHESLRGDISILMRTLPAVVRGKRTR